ncbi:FAD-dependent oxidoreductase [Streptomyces sp. PT12]|uniref:FAD-dependent oxidoreductase n=1 Tax=Streptomyces sp. PT12 TaxID=1510197 RepID=UPI0015EF195E|nr:FAD-dependent oxidoreductase [Streptomyces sp. PT12]
MSEITADIAVIGGGLGGVAAALAAARRGLRVVLTEENDWVGGQLTSQGTPPDEHPWIEQFGCTASYRALREGIRAYYRRWYPLTRAAAADRRLNPGKGRVSALCAEPSASHAVLMAMLAPHRALGRLDLRLPYHPVAATTEGDRVTGVTLAHRDSGERLTVTAPYVLDATETGALLPLTGTEYVTGFESHEDTGEPSAPDERQPLNMQAVSWCFAVEHLAGEDHTVDKPEDYAFWRDYRPDYWPDRMFGLLAPKPQTLATTARVLLPNPGPDEPATRGLAGDLDLWAFRRILARDTFAPGALASDVIIVNWPMIDYVEGPLFEVDEEEAARHRDGARRMSRSFLYWMQTEMPRPDGGTGWPGLRPRPDVVGTADGLCQAPYIRESRRILAEHTITEQEVSLAVRGERGAVRHPDSIGIGSYRIDLHPSTGGDNYIDVAAAPFQIPLGALLPRRTRNLLPAAKNIGTTHITNGCYRLHPVEWNVGEAAALLAAHCLAHGVTPHQVRADDRRLDDFRRELAAEGVELSWPEVHGW